MNNLMRGRNLINILILSLGFILIFFVFASIFLIPIGKKYKKNYKTYTRTLYEQDQAQTLYDKSMATLKDLQSKNRSIIQAYKNPFNPKAFAREYKSYFKHLQLTTANVKRREDIFTIYEVNATTKINSPTKFYKFLNAINKSENIISIEFPIYFLSDPPIIYLSFSLKVFNTNFNLKQDSDL